MAWSGNSSRLQEPPGNNRLWSRIFILDNGYLWGEEDGISLRRGLMGIPNTRDRKVRPTHPGEMLREDFMPDYGLSVSNIAKALGYRVRR